MEKFLQVHSPTDDNTKTSSFKMFIDMTGFEGKLTFTLRECNSTEASGTSGDCGILVSPKFY